MPSGLVQRVVKAPAQAERLSNDADTKRQLLLHYSADDDTGGEKGPRRGRHN